MDTGRSAATGLRVMSEMGGMFWDFAGSFRVPARLDTELARAIAATRALAIQNEVSAGGGA